MLTDFSSIIKTVARKPGLTAYEVVGVDGFQIIHAWGRPNMAEFIICQDMPLCWSVIGTAATMASAIVAVKKAA